MELQCNECQRLIGPYLMNDLDSDHRRRLEKHFEACSECLRERDLLRLTMEELRGVEEVPVPHHFFVKPSPSTQTPWKSFSRLSRVWKLTLSTAAVAVFLIVAGSVSGLRIRAEGGVLAMGFGALPVSEDSMNAQLRAFSGELLAAVEQSLESRDRKITLALLREISQSSVRLDQRQRSILRASLGDFESRFDQRWTARSHELQVGVQDFVLGSYGRVQSQYQSDLARFSDLLVEFQDRDVLQERRMGMLASAIQEVAQSSQDQGEE